MNLSEFFAARDAVDLSERLAARDGIVRAEIRERKDLELISGPSSPAAGDGLSAFDAQYVVQYRYASEPPFLVIDRAAYNLEQLARDVRHQLLAHLPK